MLPDICSKYDEKSNYNDKEKKYDLGSFGLTIFENGSFTPDPFRHEQYLLIEENGKRVLISGCSHKGILNIAKWFTPDVLTGGFHFSKLPLDSYLESSARKLAVYPTAFYTCHCTGQEQFEFMKQYMPHLAYLSCGQSITI